MNIIRQAEKAGVKKIITTSSLYAVMNPKFSVTDKGSPRERLSLRCTHSSNVQIGILSRKKKRSAAIQSSLTQGPKHFLSAQFGSSPMHIPTLNLRPVCPTASRLYIFTIFTPLKQFVLLSSTAHLHLPSTRLLLTTAHSLPMRWYIAFSHPRAFFHAWQDTQTSVTPPAHTSSPSPRRPRPPLAANVSSSHLRTPPTSSSPQHSSLPNDPSSRTDSSTLQRLLSTRSLKFQSTLVVWRRSWG